MTPHLVSPSPVHFHAPTRLPADAQAERIRRLELDVLSLMEDRDRWQHKYGALTAWVKHTTRAIREAAVNTSTIANILDSKIE